jgi:hypothetical protein
MPLLLDDKTGKPLLWKVMEDGHVAEEPNKFQSMILDDDETTYLWLIGGSGTGKSSLMPIKLFRWIRKKHGGRYLVVEPINKMVDQIARPYVEEYFNHTPLKGEWVEKTRCYKGPGYEIFFGSADKPDMLEGGQFDGIVCDEVAQYRRRVWTVLRGRVLLRDGQFFGLSTPYPGKTQAWIRDEPYEQWKMGNPSYKFVQCPSTANPAFPQEEFDRLKRELPAAEFAMRYLGEFTAAIGLVYDLRPENRELYADPPENVEVWCGMDFGFGHPTTLVYTYEKDGVIHMFREYSAHAIDYETHALNNAPFIMKYNVRRIYYDPSAPQGALEMKKEFRKLGVEVAFLAAINDRMMGISELNKLMNTTRFMISENCTETKEQFRNYAMKGDEPDKVDDDLMDALRYDVMGQRQFNAAKIRRMFAPAKEILTAGAQRINKIFGPAKEIGNWMGRI